MTKVKIMSAWKTLDLEEKINKFLEDADLRIIDIKFTEVQESAEYEPSYSAMVIYD
jgi:ribose 5-phosphate isomerase RpiB